MARVHGQRGLFDHYDHETDISYFRLKRQSATYLPSNYSELEERSHRRNADEDPSPPSQNSRRLQQVETVGEAETATSEAISFETLDYTLPAVTEEQY